MSEKKEKVNTKEKINEKKKIELLFNQRVEVRVSEFDYRKIKVVLKLFVATIAKNNKIKKYWIYNNNLLKLQIHPPIASLLKKMLPNHQVQWKIWSMTCGLLRSWLLTKILFLVAESGTQYGPIKSDDINIKEDGHSKKPRLRVFILRMLCHYFHVALL